MAVNIFFLPMTGIMTEHLDFISFLCLRCPCRCVSRLLPNPDTGSTPSTTRQLDLRSSWSQSLNPTRHVLNLLPDHREIFLLCSKWIYFGSYITRLLPGYEMKMSEWLSLDEQVRVHLVTVMCLLTLSV